MERLSIDEVIEHCKRHTERMESHSGRSQLEETPIGNSNIMKQYWEHRQVAEWLEQLKHYKDAEEQGLLYRMPCKAKQIVYILDPNLCQRIHRPFKCEVDEFVIDGKSCFAVLNGCEHYYAMRRFKAVNIDNFGKTVFLTREAAEQAFEAMKGGGE